MFIAGGRLHGGARHASTASGDRPASPRAWPHCRHERFAGQVVHRQALTPREPADPQEHTPEDSPAPCTPHLEALAGHASHFQVRGLSSFAGACEPTSECDRVPAQLAHTFAMFKKLAIT